MWLFTSEGFVSVVAHSEKPDTLLVRARDEGSLLSLVEATGATLRHTPSNDYPYRIETSPGVLSSWLADQVSNLDYPNFKSRMWSARPEFSSVLHSIWELLHDLTPDRVTEADRQRAKELYPNQSWTDHEIEMAKALGHL